MAKISSKRYGHGLVIGKFYPPHHGHKHLIDSADSLSDHLTIIVCDPGDEDPPARMRAEWLRRIHPNAEVLVVPDNVPADDSSGWAAYTIEILGKAPDAVFTSEAYGEEYALRMGCDHVSVDPQRTKMPCSGTMIRQSPLEHLAFLDPCVRAFYIKRVCILGAESTGTTTLAMALAAHYNTVWVPEYGREYSEAKLANNELDWSGDEFVHIAREQQAREDMQAEAANKILICDTDAFATSIWHERYLGIRNEEVDRLADTHRYDLYILTGIDIPFVQDGTRDGEHIRGWMHERFITRLSETGRPYLLLEGPPESRLREAVKAVDKILK